MARLSSVLPIRTRLRLRRPFGALLRQVQLRLDCRRPLREEEPHPYGPDGHHALVALCTHFRGRLTPSAA